MSMANHASTPEILSRCDEITKSQNDKRNYRGLVLGNEMKVLLISDPMSEKSAASLDVSVGHLSDPKEITGLAHLCEHMLFLGTEKYPEENAYNSYLSQNGGYCNAATYMDHTNYYFGVTSDKLEGALDRFAQFFISPLFTESMTKKELNAVNSEHDNNLANDAWRIDQVDRTLSDPNHVYSKFGTGNKFTLEEIPEKNDINLREELLKFHDKWYSSNIMALSVFGKEELDELEEMVVRLFRDVENKNVKAPEWLEHPYKDEHLRKKCYIVPVQNIRRLCITFAFPEMHKHYKSSPVTYLSHLLGHEGKGSLLSALKDKGWCDSTYAGDRSGARGFSFFVLYVVMTEEGMKHIDETIDLVFSYINMVKNVGPLERYHHELKEITDINFRFLEKGTAVGCVNRTARSLQYYPIVDVITAVYTYSEWKPHLIEEILSCLSPEKMRVGVVGKMFEDIATEIEFWYQTKYKSEDIPQETIERWKNAPLDPVLHLPMKNEFIPTNFDLKLDDGTTVEKYPIIIEDTPLMRVWFKQDDEFLVPKANLTFNFICPLVDIDPMTSNVMHLFIEVCCDWLREHLYDAELSGLMWALYCSDEYGITLTIKGYNHSQDILLHKIVDRMLNFNIDESRFEILKENYVRALDNFATGQPDYHAKYYIAFLLVEKAWENHEFRNAAIGLTAEKVQQLIPQLFSKIFVECLVHGNITKTEALNLTKDVETKLTKMIPDLTLLLPSQLNSYRGVEIRNGTDYLYTAVNKFHKNSCACLYYQVGLQSKESNAILDLFSQIISEPCFTILRTQEQLGYAVSSSVRRPHRGSQGLTICVQSEYHPEYIEERIEHFMQSMNEHVTQMSETDFENYKDSLIKNLLDKPKMMSSLAAQFWSEIVSHQYNFDRANIEAAYVKTITKEQILQFHLDFIHETSPKRHKLSIHVISTLEGAVKRKESSEEKNVSSTRAEKIVDVVQFKNSQPLYAIVKPSMNVPGKEMQQ